MNKEPLIRKARENEASDFYRLMAFSAKTLFPAIFGNRYKDILMRLFSEERNLFSFRNCFFTEIDGKIAGMVLGYDWQLKKRQDFRTGMLIMKYMGPEFIKNIGLFLRVNNIIGWVDEGEYYISNIALYPEYRSMGIGARLMEKSEEEAKKAGAKRIGLDIEAENQKAARLYKKLGYSISGATTAHLKGQKFEFHRMYKGLK